MTLDDFVKAFAGEFDETPLGEFSSDTQFRNLNEWGSLTALSILSMIDEEFNLLMTGSDLRSVSTIKELYDLIQSKL